MFQKPKTKISNIFYYLISYSFFRSLLNQKVQQLVFHKKCKEDVNGFAIVIILAVSSLTIFGAVIIKNKSFLISQDFYINGKNNHRYYAEIQHLKIFLENGCTNLWSSNCLGYPLFVTTQLFPNLVTSGAMLFFEK